ncbi:hypothetical protein TRIATDRAFT_223877 [Trichoderma atroviride IMI 206040]|uniref:Zn(2)-C6 fungal-type domain-containing protein n=1 Tax=Hypocrea atroviridis (strain ATCC 20476 / IMI 206040) TaxID=452589 RepID=G9NYF5_HYPAI|nr:uncharacterized protein TRIATDRAFT_223877 [Trichoderma atroviride IMI 206040]EHK44467.1 hypothetical protein TRIATDRAFT_223877 [Trichoderma atroviride IMI 206040]
MGREVSSKSCHTCRKRRVKCDTKKPVCTQCEKSKYECLGYDRILRIESHGVGFGTQPGRQTLIKIGQSNSYPVNAPTRTHDTSSPRGRTKGRKDRSHQTFGNCTHSATDLTTTAEAKDSRLELSHSQPSFLVQPNLEPFTDNVTFSYFFDAYSWINIHSILLQDTPMRQILAQQSDELCYDSLRALAYGIFGRDHQLDGLRRAARRIYGKALRQLQSTLMTASKHELAALIKPISIMGSYALANALVQRKDTLISEEKWKSVPWELHPEMKTNASKLVDIISGLPGIIQKTDDILNERSQIAAGSDVVPKEMPDSVPSLQQQLESMNLDLVAWRYHWSLDNNPTAQDILEWALFRISDESYRPGIHGVLGADVYGLNLGTADGLDVPFELNDCTRKEPEANIKTFSLMQEAALYLTGLIWVGRLRKNLAGAARAADAIDFYNTPFFSTCRCFYDSEPGGSRHCQVFPEPSDNMATAASWNINTAKIVQSPIRSSSHDSNNYFLDSSGSNLLLPGDGRFAAQLRILSWLVQRLPESRPYILGVLAAMGLSHCIHDVRPSEGNEYIAETVRETMKKSRYGDAAIVLLKSYQ